MKIVLLLVCTALGLSSAQAASGPVLSEFMAENNGFSFDQDGESPDWIEIENPGVAAINLAGWHLTDTPANLTLWTFPGTVLAPGARLVVFASGKNRAVAGAELHTNFELENAGEYLALVEPDGVTIAQEFAPTFPPQRSNVSFGTQRQTTVTPLIASGAQARVHVPTDDSLGAAWTGASFDDSSWTQGPTGVGFDQGGGGGGGSANAVLKIDFNDDDSGESGAANTETGFSAMTLSANPSLIGGVTVTLAALGGGVLDDRDRDAPVDAPPDLTQDQLYDDFIFVNGQVNGNGMSIRLTGLPPGQDYELTVWSYDASSLGERVSDWIETASGTTTVLATAYRYDGSIPPTQDGHDSFTALVRSSPAGVLQIEGRRSGGTSHGVFLNALQLVPMGLGPLIATDIGAAMAGQNASVFIRVPFSVADPEAMQEINLRMKFDDGYVAHINGQMVAARHAPPVPAWNATATQEHPNAEALQFELVSIPNTPGLLHTGPNVLAIQGLNVSADNSDFLILPELEGVAVAVAAGLYLKPPTPGSANGPGYPGFVEDTKFSVDRGFYDMPFTVAITTATVNAQIRWTSDGSAPTASTGQAYGGPIVVSGTRFLRAAAFVPGLIPSDVDTHTYIFLDQVLQQSATPPGYPTTWQAGYPADYGMDPNVVNHPVYGPTLKEDLRAIPTLSIVASHNELWGSSGIYNNATGSGLAWERPASVELIRPNGTTAFAVSCGLRMQGNASRDNIRTPKHNFRLLFKSDYGPSKLRHDWFGGGVDRFDNLVLRACFTDSWSTRHSPGTPLGVRYRPEDATYLRDVWMKDAQTDMGHLSGRGEHVHVYVNGLYWGLYNPAERLDESFLEEHVGGPKESWDVIRDFSEVLTGSKNDWNQMMSLVNAGITSEAAYQAVAGLVDLENLIDYMLLHFHGEAEDWPSHNWYAAHRRATNGWPATRWIFLSWDQEIIADQDNVRDRTDVSDNDTPARVYSQLRAWPEFRRLFGDRVQKHMFNNGALTPSNNVARLQKRIDAIHQAMVGESARWGDAREFATPSNPATGQTFTRDEFWIPELNALKNNWFPNQAAITLARLRADSLYPNVNPPLLNPFGGAVPAGFNLVLTHANPSGVMYFTTDNSDPRVYGSGAVGPGAQASSEPLVINGPTRIRARVLMNGAWSALVEADFYPPQNLAPLALTEIMYHPAPPGGVAEEDLEFVELKNTGTESLELTGIRFTEGIGFDFNPGTMLAPGAFFVLGRNPAALAARYPGLIVDGLYTGQLNNGGERITLSHPTGGRLISVDYDDSGRWPITPDGLGHSLVAKQPGVVPGQSLGQPFHWRASALSGGSPGADDPEPSTAGIIINEVLTHTDPPQVDYVELHNPTLLAADIGGWFLSDDRQVPKKFRIPDGPLLEPGEYRTFTEDDFNLTPGLGNSFNLSSVGEEIYLFAAQAGGALTGYSHGFNFGAAPNGVPFGRYMLSTGEDHYPAQISPSYNSPNAGPRVGPIVFGAIMYHPPDLALGADNTAEEYLELINISAQPVPLYDAFGHPWELRDAVDYVFPSGIQIPPGGRFLVLSFNPGNSAQKLEFESSYPALAGLPMFGPYLGKLDNSGDSVELIRPDTPNPDGVPEILVERVHYLDRSPWPVAADGTGAVLQRMALSGYGDDPANWRPMAELTIFSHPQNSTAAPGDSAIFVVGASGTGDLQYQWRFQGQPIAGATTETLVLPDVQEANQGFYSVTVSDSSTSLESQPAFLGVLVAPYVVQPPLAQSVVENGIVTLSVVSGGHLPMGYRWRRGTSTVFQQTLFSHTGFLTLNHVQAADAGNYTVVLTNAVLLTPGVLSAAGRLTVLADADDDLIGDTWESSHGFNPNDPADAELDTDGDGSVNRDESVAGTDPRDADSVIKVDQIRITPSLVTLEFVARPNLTYTLYSKSDLAAPGWSKVADVAAQAVERIATVNDSSPRPATRFYLLVTPALP